MVARAAAACDAIVEQLQHGETPTHQPPMPIDSAESARVDLEVAEAARADVLALVGPAEKAVAEAEAAVKAEAKSVIRAHVSALRAEADTLSAQLAALRGQINTLMPCITETRWEVRWPAAATALLVDAEAVLDDIAEPAAAIAAA